MKRRRHSDIRASIDAAVRARDDANDRLAGTRDLIAAQRKRAAAERAAIIIALARMRAQDNLARMILDTVERGTDEPGTAGG